MCVGGVTRKAQQRMGHGPVGRGGSLSARDSVLGLGDQKEQVCVQEGLKEGPWVGTVVKGARHKKRLEGPFSRRLPGTCLRRKSCFLREGILLPV